MVATPLPASDIDTAIPAAQSIQSELFNPSADQAQVMAKHAIRYDGRQYLLGPYRYDRLSDAVNYATLMAGRGTAVPETSASAAPAFAAPTDDDIAVMKSLGIAFVGGIYTLGGYRYDRLSDAVNYANLRAQRITS